MDFTSKLYLVGWSLESMLWYHHHNHQSSNIQDLVSSCPISCQVDIDHPCHSIPNSFNSCVEKNFLIWHHRLSILFLCTIIIRACIRYLLWFLSTSSSFWMYWVSICIPFHYPLYAFTNTLHALWLCQLKVYFWCTAHGRS